MTPSLPLIDVSPLINGGSGVSACAREIDRACRESGFFRITGHGVSSELQMLMDDLSRKFFDQPEAEKAKCAMPLAGTAWRWWFGVGGELTSGVPDRKEGLYIGEELPSDDARVVAGTPLHGPNLFPASPAGINVLFI